MKMYNTLTRDIDEITPLHGNKISLYTCGLTVYSQPHIGNWVAYIYWDVLVRALKAHGYDVTRVQNITDVGHLTSDEDAGEDKMLKGALREGLTAWEVAEKYIAIANTEAYEQLGLLRPDHMPKATDYISQQIAFVQELEQKGYTYTAQDGVYFDTSKLDDYGRLARLDIEGLQFGARVESTGKKNPTDFALWKFSSPNEKRDMEWASPWGTGFPGWHLECSVMAREILGDQIDIHTGGIDHIPVHHTNEIAQTEAITSKPFASYWIHANHIKVDGTKMSKSLGNIYTLKDITDKGFSLDAFKLLVLSKHYRTEGNFTWDNLQDAQNVLDKFNEWAYLQYQGFTSDELNTNYLSDGGALTVIMQQLFNDLDTHMALGYVHGMVNRVDDLGIDSVAIKYASQKINELFGLHLAPLGDISSGHKAILSERKAARDNNDWQTSDRLRDALLQNGIIVKDTKNGQIWTRLAPKS